MKYENLIVYSLCILIIILVGIMVIKIINLNERKNPNLSELDIICNKTNIFSISKCLKNELKEFYDYNISQVRKQLNITQLKESGGVCDHYSQFYKDNFIKLGAREVEQRTSFKFETTMPPFYISEIIFPIDNETSHVISIVSTSEGYCLLDQLNVECWKFNQ